VGVAGVPSTPDAARHDVAGYSFGLRHAVDADHIAAVDNVTRKLMQNGERPVAIGFVFALGIPLW
jgi:high-affinity nickel permease